MATGSLPAEIVGKQHPGLADAVRSGHRGIELENAAVADRIHRTGAAPGNGGARRPPGRGAPVRSSTAGRTIVSSQTTACHSAPVRTAGSTRGNYPGRALPAIESLPARHHPHAAGMVCSRLIPETRAPQGRAPAGQQRRCRSGTAVTWVESELERDPLLGDPLES